MKRILQALAVFTLISTGVLPAEDLKYGVGTWDSEVFGNHRVVVQVQKPADAVWLNIPWRRSDPDPRKKNIIVIKAETGERVKNVFRARIDREEADLVFEASASGKYYFYHMPFVSSGRSAYPKVEYQKPEETAEVQWLERFGLSSRDPASRPWERMPKAEVVEIQSIDEFNSFYPMEIIATRAEVENLAGSNPDATFLLFPESRKNPIRMRSDLPYEWIKRGPGQEFHATAQRGEFFVFQIGVYASARSIEDLDVEFSDLRKTSGDDFIPESALRCFNLAGTDWEGKAFQKVCKVGKGQVQALWIGVEVPRELPSGMYNGRIQINPADAESRSIPFALKVLDPLLSDGGDSEPWRHSRLRWLDSTIAIDNELVAPYTPLEVTGRTAKCLGRAITFGELNLPTSIRSYFAPEMTSLLEEESTEILSGPVQLIVEKGDGEILQFASDCPEKQLESEGAVSWLTKARSDFVTVQVTTRMEFDGVLEYSVLLRSNEETDFRDVRLQIPLRSEVARYMMGLGYKGGRRPRHFEWRWDNKNNQDSVWIGEVNAGLQVALKDENYERPLNTNFYLLKPLNLPPSWYNEGKGGIVLEEKDRDTFMIAAYGGSRRLSPGEDLHFNFRLSITPFKPLDTRSQWSIRFNHRYESLEKVIAMGANAINVHHATEINPYINYPFFRTEEMGAYVAEAHARGLRVKIYHTVRELTNRAPELFALLSLGDEVFLPGPGGGPAWLQEHVHYPYIAGWYVPKLKDAALVNSGVSRWHNFYLESLQWLVQNVAIDGLYIDDVAFDRTVMKRVRKILDRNREGALIDLHSANQFNVRDGYANSANLYLEHFPYLDRLWFGEYFDYDSAPDFWMVEVSGIPFGLMGEMLQDGGNPYRGMVYGMTSRYPWSQDPPKLWRLWDDFGIEESQMIGYWAPACPVRTDHPEVLATAYVKEGEALICMASWAQKDVSCRLIFQWDSLGIDQRQARLLAPAVGDLQDETVFLPDAQIPVSAGKGWYLWLTADR